MKKLNSKGSSPLHIVLILIIIGLIAGVGYYVYTSQKKTNTALDNAASSQAEPQKSEGEDIKVVNTRPPESTYEGWKKYSSEESGISFMYPSTWSIDTYDCIGADNKSTGTCARLGSPIDSQSTYQLAFYYYFDSSADAGSVYVVTSEPISILNSEEQYSIVGLAANLDVHDKIGNFGIVKGLTESNSVQRLSLTIPVIDKKDKQLSLSGYMLKPGQQQNLGHTLAEYEAHPEYQNFVNIFKSISY